MSEYEEAMSEAAAVEAIPEDLDRAIVELEALIAKAEISLSLLRGVRSAMALEGGEEEPY